MNSLPASGKKLRLMSGLVTAFLISTAFILIFFFLSTFTEPLMPQVVNREAQIGIWEACELSATGQLYLMRPVNSHQREPHSTSGVPLRDNRLPRRPGDKEAESIHPTSPMTQFYEQYRPEPAVAHQLMLFTNLGDGFEYWYFVKHTKPRIHGYFVGYHSENREWLGYIGRNGPQQTRPSFEESIALIDAPQAIISPPTSSGYHSAQMFPTVLPDTATWEGHLELGRRVWLATPEGVLLCNLGDRSIKTFAAIADLQGLQFYSDTNKRTLRILAASSVGLRLFDDTGRQQSQADFPWPQSRLDKDHVIASRHVAVTQANELILIEPEAPKPKEATQVTTISWFEPSGKLAKKTTQTLGMFEFPDVNRPKEPLISTTNAFESLLGALGFASHFLQHYSDGTPLFAPTLVPFLAVNVLLTVTLVLFLWWRQYQLCQSWIPSIAWTLFLLVFGSSGFVGYLFYKPWTQGIRCDSCGKLRASDQPLCPHCGQALQKPKSLGTEIFPSDPHLVLAQTG